MGKMGGGDSSLSLPVAAVCCKVKDAMQPAVNIGSYWYQYGQSDSK